MSLSRLERMTYVEIVAQVLVADSAMTDEEDAFFTRLVARMGLTDDERAAVVKRINIGAEVAFDAATLGDEARKDLMKTLAEAAATDGNVTPRELDILERVGAVLRIQAAHPGLKPR